MSATSDASGWTIGTRKYGSSKACAKSSNRSRRSCQASGRVGAGQHRDVEDVDAELVAVTRRTLQGRHRSCEPVHHQLGVEDDAFPEDRESLREPPDARSGRSIALSVANLAAAIPGLDDSIRAEDDERANAVDLRLDRETVGFSDRRAEGSQAPVPTSCGVTSSTAERRMDAGPERRPPLTSRT